MIRKIKAIMAFCPGCGFILEPDLTKTTEIYALECEECSVSVSPHDVLPEMLLESPVEIFEPTSPGGVTYITKMGGLVV